MNYTIQKLASLTGTTVRTLRFYDEIGLLKPAQIGDNGYRYYQQIQLIRLQQILFFRELDFDLKQIQAIFNNPNFDHATTLQDQKKLLQKKISRQKRLIKTIEHTLKRIEQSKTMSPTEMINEYQQSLQDHITNTLPNGKEINKQATADVLEKTAGWTWEKDWTPYLTKAKAIIANFEELYEKKHRASSAETQAVARRNFEHGSLLQTLTKEKVLQNAVLLRDKKFLELSAAANSMSYEVASYIADAMEYFANNNL